MSLSITAKDFSQFVSDLTSQWPVYGPVENQADGKSRFRFKKIKNSKELAIPYAQTVIPPKKYLFPAKGSLFGFEKGEILPPKNKDFVLLGINKRDGEGLFYLNEVMTKPIPDDDYLARRAVMKVIVIDSLAPSNALDCDLYLQKVDNDHFLAYSYSEFGEKLIRNKFFGYSSETGSISTRNLPDEVTFHPKLDQILENSRNHPVWNELAETCFNCGICSYVCPLCYCFDVEDSVEITKDTTETLKGNREKRWDSCMLPDFGAVTFHNFRPEAKDRIYNWYYHKFVRMPREYGFPGCVDCGRCTQFCPAKIKFREVLKELIKDAK